MNHTTAPKKMRLLQKGLATAIMLLAAAHGLRAQDTTIVPCDGGSVPGIYCYVNNDNHTWYWECPCGSPITLHFTSGTIEPNDHLSIYDGPDNTSPLLFSSGQVDLSLIGLELVSSGSDMYMKFTSDPTNCCATDGLLGTAWNWTASDGSSTAGINEAQAESFTMYPNPAVNELSLRLTSNTNGPAEIRILDVSGRVVYQNSFTANGAKLNTFDLHGLQSGNYSVVLTTPNWVKAESLQVIR